MFFNLSDTLHAEIENLEAIVALDTVVNVFKSSNSKYHLEYPTEYKDYYRFRNSPCIELSSAPVPTSKFVNSAIFDINKKLGKSLLPPNINL